MVLVRDAITVNGIGPIHRNQEIMGRFAYLNIVENVLLPFAKEYMPEVWIYRANNDPKHTARVVNISERT